MCVNKNLNQLAVVDLKIISEMVFPLEFLLVLIWFKGKAE